MDAENVIKDALKKSRFISLQDSNHGVLAIKEGVTQLLPLLAVNHVKHLLVEMHPSNQSIIDDFYSGKRSKKEVEDYFFKHPGSMWVKETDRVHKYARGCTR